MEIIEKEHIYRGEFASEMVYIVLLDCEHKFSDELVSGGVNHVQSTLYRHVPDSM
ncbi:unnamed protein product [marine sediment metagenome]|uniref:Uncharacterized protein n=1 Tax=marine sediment metagenome TaxID=412755 RepID=X1F5E9_9ZZZZ